MSLTYNGTEPTEITYNGSDVETVIYNGTTVWTKPSQGETWVLNAALNDGVLARFYINFSSNNTNFSSIYYHEDMFFNYGLSYDSTEVASRQEGSTTTSWTNEAYRTITFETAPTGDLLTWLQRNGVKQ